MKRRDIVLAGMAGFLVVALVLMLPGKPFAIARPLEAPRAGDELSILVWNIGYGGLGEESDFIADGGENFFPPSSKIVRKNIAGVVETLRDINADVYVIPETAKRTPLTWWNDVLGALDKAFPNEERAFSADILTRFMPWPLRFEHGLAIYSRKHISAAEAEPLPREREKIAGFISRDYSARILRLPTEQGADWIVIGVHLAAFDENAETRRAQVAALMRLAEALNKQGHPVVIGGDFNLVLTPFDRPSTTSAEDRAWVHPFPMEAPPAGWRIGADPATPTVRTNERPYKPGENLTTIIDGFIVSPDVEIVSVATRDLGFRFSDHQPVRLVARRK